MKSDGANTCSVTAAAVLAAGLAAATMGGCVKRFSDTGETVVSADGAVQAHVHVTEVRKRTGPMEYTGRLKWESERTVAVQWRTALGLPRKAELPLTGAEEDDELKADEMVRLVFSPDGRRLAAVARRKIWIIDTVGGSKRELTEGLADVISFGWLSNEEVGFASQARVDPAGTFYSPHYRFDITFWRCRAGPTGRPGKIRRLRNVEQPDHSRRRGQPRRPQHDWLPDGRVVARDSGETLLKIKRQSTRNGDKGP